MFKLIIDNLKNFSNSSGPWGGGPWGGNNGNQGNGNRGNSSGGKDNSSNSNNNNSKNTNNFFKKNNNSSNNNNDSDDFITKIIKQVLKFFNDFSAQSQNPTKAPKSGIGIMVLIIILTYLSFGFYKVDPDENAVTLYFGKF